MAQEVVQYCLTILSALGTNHTYGNAVTVDGMCITVTATVILLMWVLIVTDVRHTVIDTGLEILLI
jgi:riboflavin synthase alpha subunit